MHSKQYVYRRGQLSAEQIQHEINEFWVELKSNNELHAEVSCAGLSSDELSQLDKANAIRVQVNSSGLDPLSVSLIVMFAPAANRIVKDVWATVMLPRIRQRWGDDAVGDEIHAVNKKVELP